MAFRATLTAGLPFRAISTRKSQKWASHIPWTLLPRLLDLVHESDRVKHHLGKSKKNLAHRRWVCASSHGIRFCCLLVFAVLRVIHREAV